MLPPELAASRLRLLLTWQADNIERSYRIPSYSLRKVDIIYIYLFIIYIFTRNFYLTVINFARLLAASAFHKFRVNCPIYIYGTVHAKIAYRVYIYKVIKMTHFEIAASPEP